MTLPPRLAVRMYGLFETRLGVLLGRVGAAAVGALDDQDIGGRQHGGVAQQRDLGPPEVAGIDQPPVLGLKIQGDDGRAQHVPGIVKGQGDARHQLVRLFIADALKVAQTLDRVLAGVDGVDRGLAISGAMPVDVFHVFLLDMAAVREHIAAQVRRGLGADHLAPETMFHQVGDIARMVDMGVRQDHHIHQPGREGQFPVAPPGLVALAFIEAAVQENPLLIHRDQMLGTGDRLGCPEKGNFHLGTSNLI